MNHETFDATMKNMVVKVAVFAMNTKVFNGFWTFFAKKLNMYVANGGMKYGSFVNPLGSYIKGKIIRKEKIHNGGRRWAAKTK